MAVSVWPFDNENTSQTDFSPNWVGLRIAYEIECELICCDEYDKYKGEKDYVIKHQICWWGSYAREIALRIGKELDDQSNGI